jgi:hypothetical protein
MPYIKPNVPFEVGATSNGRRKMRPTRISEDLLFTVLLAALAGWLVAPLAGDPSAASDSGTRVAVAAADHNNSGTSVVFKAAERHS